MHNRREFTMKFEEMKVEFEKLNSLDIIAESPEVPTTRSPYSNEGTNDPFNSDPF